MGFLIWLVAVFYWVFNPTSSLGKKAIFLSWVFGPCNLAFVLLFKPSAPIMTTLSGLELLPVIGAFVLAYKFGEPVVDKINPNGGRFKYLLIGIASSIFLPMIINFVLK